MVCAEPAAMAIQSASPTVFKPTCPPDMDRIADYSARYKRIAQEC
jgi:hypothetical protein